METLWDLAVEAVLRESGLRATFHKRLNDADAAFCFGLRTDERLQANMGRMLGLPRNGMGWDFISFNVRMVRPNER